MKAPDHVPDFHALLGDDATPIGTWLTSTDPAAAEIIAGSGLDFIAIDGEHGVVDVGSLGPILAAIRPHGIPALFRVAENEQSRIQHALDAGASGVIIPRVRSAADAARAARATRYPPGGTRGIGPRRAGGYGRDGGYLARANGLVACVVQVETREAVDDLDAILATPDVDALLVGPYDLSGALGHTAEIDHPEVATTIEIVRARAAARGVPVGIHVPSAAAARVRIAQGFAFVTVATDYALFAGAVDAMVAGVRG
jgi:2-keto-3-deoxy-L-rhamnonate aldolase RhmA